jgi:hypothetical protein
LGNFADDNFHADARAPRSDGAESPAASRIRRPFRDVAFRTPARAKPNDDRDRAVRHADRSRSNMP